jgi:ketosteroid isomerase-like protein
MSKNLATLRRGYEAFSRGDLSEFEQLITPDVEWGATGAFQAGSRRSTSGAHPRAT